MLKQIKSVLKKKIRAFFTVLPFGLDLYLILMRERIGLSYRGKFESFSSARNAAKKEQAEYDVINRNKSKNKERENAVLDTWHQDHDYPYLFWGAKLVTESKRVVELGGSLGHFYYELKRLSYLPENIQWIIAELPNAVRLGEELAKERQAKNLRFIDSTQLARQECELFFTAGTIQYMEQTLWDILSELAYLPEKVLIHHLPTHATMSSVTLQNLGVCEVPYRIYADNELMQEMQRLGYRLEQRWAYPRYIDIPFHRSYHILGYLGYYFEKRAVEKIHT